MARINAKQQRRLNSSNPAAFDAKLGDAVASYRQLALAVFSGTGTGGAQNWAHGFVDENGVGVVPNIVAAIPQDANLTAFTYGTHTATNAVITATNNAKYLLVVGYVPNV